MCCTILSCLRSARHHCRHSCAMLQSHMDRLQELRLVVQRFSDRGPSVVRPLQVMEEAAHMRVMPDDISSRAKRTARQAVEHPPSSHILVKVTPSLIKAPRGLQALMQMAPHPGHQASVQVAPPGCNPTMVRALHVRHHVRWCHIHHCHNQHHHLRVWPKFEYHLLVWAYITSSFRCATAPGKSVYQT